MHVLNISHKDCLDGLTSAWLVRRAFCAPTDKVVTALAHAGEPLPEFPRQWYDLILVTDISFNLEEMEYLATHGPVVVLDHHESAFRTLAGTPFAGYLSRAMSGALLTYNYLTDHDYRLVPEAYDMASYVSDGDLWEFKMPDSKAIQAFLRLRVRGLDDVGPTALSLGTRRGECRRVGETVLVVTARQVEDACRKASRVTMGGLEGVPCVNSTVLRSEVGNALAQRSPHGFGVVWWQERGKVLLSFRAIDSSGKCLKIAEELGGGGHLRACGASLDYDAWSKILETSSFGD